MTAYALKLAIHTLLCFILMWTCWCRQVRSTDQTIEAVRIAFWCMFMAAMVLLAAPLGHKLWPDLWPRYRIQWPDLAMLASATLVQLVTARHWHRGPPAAFQQQSKQP